jgi:hypothetical protein
MIDAPGLFDPVEVWEEFLIELLAMPNFLGKEGTVKDAERLIAERTRK